MIEKQSIQHYRKAQLEFLKQYKRVAKKPSRRNIHRLRVAIKKLNAIWRLVEVVSDGEFDRAKHKKAYSRLFSAAGEVRDAQVGLKKVARLGDERLAPFETYLRSRKGVAKKWLKEEVKAFDCKKVKSLDRTLLGILVELDDEHVHQRSKEYVRHEVEVLLQKKRELEGSRELHQIRIRLKRFGSVLVMMDHIEDLSELSHLKADIKFLSRRIGRWHDLNVLIVHLNELCKAKLKKKELKNIKEVMDELHSKQQKMKKKVYREVEERITEEWLDELGRMD